MTATGVISGRRDAMDTFAVSLMVLLTFSWGLNQVAVKISNTGYNPVFLSIVRSAIGAALVLAWCHYRRIPLFEKDGTLVVGLVAGSLFAIEFVLIFFGLDYTSAARGTLMVNTMPFWVLLGGHFFLGERITLTKFLGLALAFAGVVLVFSDQLSLPGPDAIRGDVLCLVAGILWAVTTILIKNSRLVSASAEKTLMYQLGVSAVASIPLLPFAGPAFRDVSTLATGAVLFQAVYVVAFTYILWFWLVSRYPASGLASFAFLSPVFGVLCGGVLLGEPLSIKIFLALGLIAIGLLVVNRPVRRGIPG